MNILGCLDHPTSGKYWLDGQEMSGLTPNQRALVRTGETGLRLPELQSPRADHGAAERPDAVGLFPAAASRGEARRLARTC